MLFLVELPTGIRAEMIRRRTSLEPGVECFGVEEQGGSDREVCHAWFPQTKTSQSGCIQQPLARPLIRDPKLGLDLQCGHPPRL
jgi:hypothetical protein